MSVLFAPVVGVARLVGSGRRTWLKRLGSVDLLYIIRIIVVKPIVKVRVFVAKFATAFRHGNIFKACYFSN